MPKLYPKKIGFFMANGKNWQCLIYRVHDQFLKQNYQRGMVLKIEYKSPTMQVVIFTINFKWILCVTMNSMRYWKKLFWNKGR